MMERKEGEELDEIERQVEDLKIESIVNETASPMKQPDRTVDSLVNPERAPPAGNPQEERKDVNYSVQWNNAAPPPPEEEKNPVLGSATGSAPPSAPVQYQDNAITEARVDPQLSERPAREWAKIAANPSEADSSKATMCVLFLFAVEIAFFIIVIVPVAALGDENEIEYPAHIVFALYYTFKCAMAFVFAVIIRGQFTKARVPMTNEGLQGAVGAITLCLILFAGTWPYFAFCFVRMHSPSKTGVAYGFYGCFGVIVLLHLLMLLAETVFTYRVKLRGNECKPALEKMRLLQKLSYYTNWAPLYIVLHRFDAYLAEQPAEGAKSDFDVQESALARVLCLGRNVFVVFLALLATTAAGAVKDRDLTVYAVLFGAALATAYLAEVFIFSRMKPETRDIQTCEAS